MQPQIENKNTPGQLPQIADSLKSATNVLVTVSANPSVDQLAACIGLTISLNKLGKHATAVFSGRVPSTIEFLQPDKTLETNTDSLRDFIISLDKSKADKLRYKVEENLVKIFITPYRTSISDKDLEFTQGDFNVDSVIALGVHERSDLDTAIMTHGRILHDATVVSLTINSRSELGAINWLEPKASSLCEMVTDLITQIDDKLIDGQVATALLTGMVAETDRFGNEKATPHTMSLSGVLMSAGASPQLISAKLDEPQEPGEEIPAVVSGESDQKEQDGVIEIDHNEPAADAPAAAEPEAAKPSNEDDIQIDEHGKLHTVRDFRDREPDNKTPDEHKKNTGVVLEPPRLGGQLTANDKPEAYSPSTDPLTAQSQQGTILNRDLPVEAQAPALQQEPPSEAPTLSEIEQAVDSPHIASDQVPETTEPAEPQQSDVPPPLEEEAARQAVEQAKMLDESLDRRPEPLKSSGATGSFSVDHTEEPSQPPQEPKPEEPSESGQDYPPPPVPPPPILPPAP